LEVLGITSGITVSSGLPEYIMMNAMYLAPAQGYRLKKRTAPMRSSIGPKDVQIRLKAVAINPADIKMIDEGHRVLEWPIVPGLDGAGIVEAVGAEVERVAVGEEVLAQFTPGPSHAGGGSFQMSGVVNEMMVARKPKNLIWEEAASIP
jgi:NADPH:quinone reductase-like Zn-dependent oxidoreductase